MFEFDSEDFKGTISFVFWRANVDYHKTPICEANMPKIGSNWDFLPLTSLSDLGQDS